MRVTTLCVLLMFRVAYFSGLQQTIGLPICPGMLVCIVDVLAQSFLFGHIKSYFLTAKVILSSFLGHKNDPNDRYTSHH